MASVLHDLPRSVLEELASALSSQRLQPPYSAISLHQWLDSKEQYQVSQELARLQAAGMTPAQIGIVLDLLATERAREQRDDDRIQMVWTGLDQEGPAARDTGVVARELLGQATKSLLITTFSLSRDFTTFQPVHEAMDRNPSLDVTIILHIDMSRQKLFGEEAVNAFRRTFWATQWPWPHRPKVYYDPRGTSDDPMKRTLQHSKCIVSDLERVFVTSSNYTESGQLRNIELGVLIRDQRLASRVVQQFRTLSENRLLVRLPQTMLPPSSSRRRTR